ncbi:hypothetical protein [Flindersiella endophytica]
MTRKDIGATLFTGAAVGVYVAYLQNTDVTLISSVRGAAGVVLLLGIFGCAFSDASALSRGTSVGGYRALMATVASITGIAGLLAIILGNALMLAILVYGTALIWLIATFRHVSTTTPAKPSDFTHAKG